MPAAPNPYQTTEIAGDAIGVARDDDTWSLRDGVLYCGPNTTLPKICYATLATTGLVPYERKLKRLSFISEGIVVVGVPALFLSRDAIGLSVTEFVLALVGIFLGAGIIERTVSRSIRLRLYESQAVRESRRKRTFLSYAFKGQAVLVGVGLFWTMMDGTVSSPAIVPASFLAAAIGFFGPDLLLKGNKAPSLVAMKSEGGLFAIGGLSPEFSSALEAHYRDTRIFEHS